MKRLILLLFFVCAPAPAVNFNPDETVTLTAKEWLEITGLLQTFSSDITIMSRDLFFNQNTIKSANLKNEALKQANASIMGANTSLLSERDSLIVKLSAMANCPKAPVISAPTNAILRWAMPTERINGVPILPAEIGGYFLHYGTDKDNLNARMQLPDRNTREYVINGFPTGTYYFSISPYDTGGVEGFRSSVVNKIVK